MLQDTTFWVGLTFVITIALIWRPVSRAVLGNLDSRSDRIRRQIEEARRLREDAQALLVEYQKKQRDAMAEAERIIAQARDQATRYRVEAEKDLERSIERRKQQALDRIAQSEAQALAEVRNAAVDVAIAASEKLIRETLDQAAQNRLIDDAVRELPARLH